MLDDLEYDCHGSKKTAVVKALAAKKTLAVPSWLGILHVEDDGCQ